MKNIEYKLLTVAGVIVIGVMLRNAKRAGKIS